MTEQAVKTKSVIGRCIIVLLSERFMTLELLFSTDVSGLFRELGLFKKTNEC